MPDARRVGRNASCRALVAAGALYDLAVVGPLATPWTATPQLETMNAINQLLGFSGSMPVFSPVHILFINLFGVFVVLWALTRLFYFQARLALVDLIVRLCVSSILLWYALEGNVNGIVKLFLAIELLVATLDFAAMRLAAKEQLARIDV